MCFFKSKTNTASISLINNNKTQITTTNIELPTTKINRDLVVDDSDPNRLVIKKYLVRFGRQMDEATNGQHAIEVISNTGTYNIIWMDIQMPKMNGIKCTEYLRTNLKYTGTIIGLTGLVDQESIDDCLNAGMNDVMAKPIDKKVLQAYIEKYQK